MNDSGSTGVGGVCKTAFRDGGGACTGGGGTTAAAALAGGESGGGGGASGAPPAWRTALAARMLVARPDLSNPRRDSLIVARTIFGTAASFFTSRVRQAL